MFHSYFNEYAFDDINIYLLTSVGIIHFPVAALYPAAVIV